MKKISLQWRLTCIITLYIAVICGCLTLLVYKNGIYYIDSLQETVDARGVRYPQRNTIRNNSLCQFLYYNCQCFCA